MVELVERRQAEMSVDLGGEQVELERMRCTEELGQPFVLTVDIIATLGEIDLLPHLGKPLAVTLNEDEEEMRHFHGLITEGEFLKESSDGFHYRLVAQPFTYFLSQNRDMAIFQDLSVRDIIDKVFVAAGISNYKLELAKTYDKRTYCVQYRESDFGFLTRLMEEEGLYYYYRHAADKHELVICDAPTAHSAATPATLRYNPDAATVVRAGSAARGGDRWFLDSLGERVSSGGEAKVTLRAFDFEKSGRPLQADAASPKPQHPGDAREVYDYPTPYVDEGKGGKLSAIRLESLRRERQVYTGSSQAVSLACGRKLKVSHHPTERFNQEYLITRTETTATAESFSSGYATGETGLHETVFEAIPAATAFHIPQVTPKPRVEGLETAIVTGPAGEEIYTDPHGRVKVRFHWDRADTAGEKSTCWIRVAQFGNLGSLILPRIDEEVMVDFLHGDPDQPIVTGWVFNDLHKPVYALPANMTRSLWRTKSTPGGKSTAHSGAKKLDTADPGANELRFEDKAGKEEVFLHAEKDMNLRTRNDQTNHVAHNQFEKVYVNRDAWVGGNEKTVVDGNQDMTVGYNQNEEILQGNRKTEVKKGNDTLKVAMGNIKVDADLGKIEIEAMQSITLKVGQSKITIDQIGVKIEGMIVKADGKIMLQTKGLMSQHTASAINTIKGALVMIN